WFDLDVERVIMSLDNMTIERTVPNGGGHPPRGGRSQRPAAMWVLALCLLVGAFLLGRKSSRPMSHPVEARSDSAGMHAGGEHGGPPEEKQEKGVVKFTPEALARAGLRIQRVVRTAMRSSLEVTGAVEPNSGGVVKITPRVAGKITSLRANIGDSVAGGAV